MQHPCSTAAPGGKPIACNVHSAHTSTCHHQLQLCTTTGSQGAGVHVCICRHMGRVQLLQAPQGVQTQEWFMVCVWRCLPHSQATAANASIRTGVHGWACAAQHRLLRRVAATMPAHPRNKCTPAQHTHALGSAAWLNWVLLTRRRCQQSRPRHCCCC